MIRLVLLRHGESIWNRDDRFTGWTDVGLTAKGGKEAKRAGLLLKKEAFSFDIAYTSVLKRAIKTLWHVLDEMDMQWLPVVKDWRLNERHYGALQGLYKSDTAAEYGEEQVRIWRRSYDVRPPALAESDARCPGNDPRYKNVEKRLLPLCESLKDTAARFIPYWQEKISPDIRDGKSVLITAHGNSLRALVMHLESISRENIIDVEIPTGIPVVYELDEEIKVKYKYMIGNS